ncbi:DUF3052 domain-containing protein [Streptomyces sp. NPDC059989]|uniref:DUF3052 domain-containing protein n=1 Tax=Streptomyces sp. NPDC059989 TaxID=3347026 RepID=UPI003692840E
MSETRNVANVAVRLGFEPGMVVREMGNDDDTDESVRNSIVERTGTALVDEDHEEAADAVIIWFRLGDGDLVDCLVDAADGLEGGAFMWLLTPKEGRPGYVEREDVEDAAASAGFQQRRSATPSPGWNASQLIAPKR